MLAMRVPDIRQNQLLRLNCHKHSTAPQLCSRLLGSRDAEGTIF